jgi:hypothetical protein
MKKLLITVTFIISILNCQGQNENRLKSIKTDINNNGVIDLIRPLNSDLELIIDGKKFKINYENDFGFENIGEVKYINNVITIISESQGTGLWTYTYKFRYNKAINKIELIGYDDFNKWVSGNMTTSINLITGKYEVAVEEWNEQKQNHDKKLFTGKKTFKKIYLTELRQTELNKLSEIGLQYVN